MNRFACAYKYGELYIFTSSMQTVDGVWIDSAPVVRLTAEAEREDLANAVRTVLTACKIGVPHPRVPDAAGRVVLNAAGVRSWTQLCRKCQRIEIDLEDEDLRFTPTENFRDGGSFEPLEGVSIEISRASPGTDIGEAILSAFSRCR